MEQRPVGVDGMQALVVFTTPAADMIMRWLDVERLEPLQQPDAVLKAR